MDNLARNAMLARQAGMSYGKWKALQHRAEPAKKETKSEWERVCPYCGETFIKMNRRRKIFCSDYCRIEVEKERTRQRKEQMNNDK
jgi:predicted nucleic acid-binding Zn ribbon protein